jgi:hypothetical protein
MGLSGGAGEVGGDDVGGMPVQAASGPVIPHCGSRVSVGGGLLHVTERHTGIETGRERITNHAEYLSAPDGEMAHLPSSLLL